MPKQVEIQIPAAQAWLAHAQGNRADALKHIRAAADLEDSTEKHVAMENRYARSPCVTRRKS